MCVHVLAAENEDITHKRNIVKIMDHLHGLKPKKIHEGRLKSRSVAF